MSDEQQHSRHLRLVRMTGKFVLDMVKTSKPRVIACDGVPPDAKVLRMGYDNLTDAWIVVYEHESFPLCDIGRIPETLMPRFTEYYGDAAIDALTKAGAE